MGRPGVEGFALRWQDHISRSSGGDVRSLGRTQLGSGGEMNLYADGAECLLRRVLDRADEGTPSGIE